MVYLIMETKSTIIAGTVIREVTWCCFMASSANLASNFGIKIWQPPTINMVKADDKPPIWHNGAVCK